MKFTLLLSAFLLMGICNAKTTITKDSFLKDLSDASSLRITGVMLAMDFSHRAQISIVLDGIKNYTLMEVPSQMRRNQGGAITYFVFFSSGEKPTKVTLTREHVKIFRQLLEGLISTDNNPDNFTRNNVNHILKILDNSADPLSLTRWEFRIPPRGIKGDSPKKKLAPKSDQGTSRARKPVTASADGE